MNLGEEVTEGAGLHGLFLGAGVQATEPLKSLRDVIESGFMSNGPSGSWPCVGDLLAMLVLF